MAGVSEPEEIDRLAEELGYFHPEWDGNSYKTIQAYLSGELDLSAAVPRIADPIDERYSTADGARAIHEAERAAEHQRQYHDAVKAEELWGVPLRPDELPPLADADNEEFYTSTEGLLWDFWYGVLHAARRIPWRDGEADHLRLVALVRALKDRPDPPPPKPMTKALRNNWIWASESFWSTLMLLGPSARESWNDFPGCGAGYELPEIHAWTNVNAFIAHLTDLEVADFLLYSVWAMREGLETEPTDDDRSHHRPATAITQQNALVPPAAVWILVLGKKLYDLTAADETLEWGNASGGGPLWREHSDAPTLTRERWRFWKERLGILRNRETLSQETREIAAEAFRKMEEIEN